jgi:hypothetical protein
METTEAIGVDENNATTTGGHDGDDTDERR